MAIMGHESIKSKFVLCDTHDAYVRENVCVRLVDKLYQPASQPASELLLNTESEKRNEKEICRRLSIYGFI